MRDVLQSLVERFQGIRHTWPQVPEVAFTQDQVWYAGLAVCPVDFSRQLATLQLSLQGQIVTPGSIQAVSPAVSVVSGQNGDSGSKTLN
jgi:hypothetical protein